MFERYTERARRVIFFARYEASQLGSEAIGGEHLLLGLLREGKGITARLIDSGRLSAEAIRKEVEGRAAQGQRAATSVEIPLAPEAQRALSYAAEEAERMLHGYVGTEHILLGLLREEGGMASRLLHERGLRLPATREEVVLLLNEQSGGTRAKETPLLSEFSRDLTDVAARGQVDPLVGREGELARIIQILGRRTRNNPLLIGEPGVGKTALVEGLAQRIVRGDVPSFLADKRILALDLSLIVAGTKYRGQFEERLKAIMKEIGESRSIILFIDEMHTLVGAGSAEGSLDAANILKPALSRGEIQCIGATTPTEHRRQIERDRALERRFQAVRVLPPGESETLKILSGLKDRYERFHGVSYRGDALEAAVRQSNRYLTERYLPDKAIDVLDEAGSRVKLREASTGEGEAAEVLRLRTVVGRSAGFGAAAAPGEASARLSRKNWTLLSRVTPEVTKDDVDQVVSQWTGIPVVAVREEESDKLLRMEEELHRRIVAQDAAIEAVARAIRRSRAGIWESGRPMGSFLFLGPTGVGKTEVARALGAHLFASERRLVRFDMSEYMEKHAVSRLIGSPPGYVGHEEGGQLSERVRRNPYCVVLLDEIEKAHPDIVNILLQICEDGQLTDALGHTVDFQNTILIMTSNIGAHAIQKAGRLGFADHQQPPPAARGEVMAELRRVMNPELINRIDQIIVFDALTEDELGRVARLLLARMCAALERRGLSVKVRDETTAWLLEQTSGERHYGARPLRRAIERYIESPLSDRIIGGALRGAALLEIGVREGALWYWNGEQGAALDRPARV